MRDEYGYSAHPEERAHFLVTCNRYMARWAEEWATAEITQASNRFELLSAMRGMAAEIQDVTADLTERYDQSVTI